MSGQKKQTVLAKEIAEALNGVTSKRRASGLSGGSVSRHLLLAGVAMAALQPGNAEAVAVGELKVISGLGQPFVATTIARTAPGQVITPDCLGAVAGMPGGNDSPVPLNIAVAESSSPGEYAMRITSSMPMYEPMYEIQLKVSCQGMAALARNYIVMLNVSMMTPPAQVAATPAPDNQSTPLNVRPIAATVNEARTTQAVSAESFTLPTAQASEKQDISADIDSNSSLSAGSQDATPNSTIPGGSKYRVRRGDTLFTIAQRVEGRAGVSFRQVAGVIFDENPAAFIGGNPDMIKMGLVVTVPSGQALLNAVEGRKTEAAPSLARAAAGLFGPTAALAGDSTVQQPGSRAEQGAADSAPEQSGAVPGGNSSSQIADSQAPGTGAAAQSSAVSNQQTESATADAVSASRSTPEESAEAVTETAESEVAPASANAAPTVQVSQAPGTEGDPAAASPSAAAGPGETAIGAGSAVEAEPATPQQAAIAPVAPAPEPATTAAKPNPMIAAATGTLIGAFLAALVLGRGLITGWLPARFKRSNRALVRQENQSDTLVNPDIDPAEPAFAAPEGPASQTATGTTHEPDIAVSAQESSLGSADLNPGLSAKPAEDKTEAPAFAAFENEASDDGKVIRATESPVEPSNEPPRISLRDTAMPSGAVDFDMSDIEEPLEHTSRYSNPASLLAEDKPAETSELEGTGTMRNLFGTAEVESLDPSAPDVTSTMHDIFDSETDSIQDCAKTEEIPGLRDPDMDRALLSENIDDTSSLQSLSESVASGESDDMLSKTLTQALGLLEQDYEDELTNSQMLKQEEIQKAFAEQARKDS